MQPISLNIHEGSQLQSSMNFAFNTAKHYQLCTSQWRHRHSQGGVTFSV